MGNRPPGEHDLEVIDLDAAKAPRARERSQYRHDSRWRLFVLVSVVAVLSASVAVAAMLALSSVRDSVRRMDRRTRYRPAGARTIPGRVRFGLFDRFRGRRAGAGDKWLVVKFAVTNTDTSARSFNAGTMVELNAYELKIYGIDPTALEQFRKPIAPRTTVRRVLLFRVPVSISGMYLTLRPDLDTATARGQAGVIDPTCC